MADLTEPAHTALQEVVSLRERIVEAREGCRDSAGHLTALSEQLKTDREALHHVVEELDRSVEAASHHLSEDLAAAEPALSDIVGASQQAGSESLQLFQAEAGAMDEVAHHLQGIGAQLAALCETAATTSRTAMERAGAVADALEKTIDDTEQILSIEFSSVVADLGRELEAVTVAACSQMHDQCAAILQAADQEFERRTGEVREAVERLFPQMAQHAEEVAVYSLEKLGHAIEEEMDELSLQAQAVGGDLENASRVATEKQAEIARNGDALAQHQAADGSAAKRLEGVLHEVRGRWRPFGFAV